MWHKPQLLNALSDLLFVAGLAAYLAAAALWLQRQPLLPLQQVVFVAPSQHLLREDMATALAPQLKGNFISLNLDAIRATLELQPWVRRAEVRRAWPASLEVRIEEQKPAARWGDNPNDLVNTYGELFKASLPDDEARALPLLSGPKDTAPELLQRYAEFAKTLQPIARRPRQLSLSPRLAWQLRLDDGMTLDLGREQSKAPLTDRLARFVEVYPSSIANRQPRPAAADLRYPNGFALRGALSEVKGKE